MFEFYVFVFKIAVLTCCLIFFLFSNFCMASPLKANKNMVTTESELTLQCIIIHFDFVDY